MTFAEFKALFYEAVHDAEGTHAFFSATQVTNWTNKALREMAEATQFYDLQITFNTSSGYPQYALGSNIFNVWRVEVDNRKMEPTTIQRLMETRTNFRARSGRPVAYYLDGVTTNPDQYQIGLWEKPNATYASRALAHGMPVAVADDDEDDNMHVPDWMAYAVLWSVMSDAYKADTRVQNLEASSFYRHVFDDHLNRLKVRSFNKLPKDWHFRESGGGLKFDMRFNLPATISAP